MEAQDTANREVPASDLRSQQIREMNDWLGEPSKEGPNRDDALYKELLNGPPAKATLPPPGNEEEAWRQCAKLIEKHDDDACKAYREEIDTLLVFAGLFSAVVTAFSVESYQWLQTQPNDPTVEILARLTQLLSHNATVDYLAPAQDTVGPGLSPSTAARINALWFLSLTFSLTAALVGILCKEWVREFGREAGGQSTEDFCGLRQMKFEGFEAWKVPEIISAVPLLLQLALWLFLLGVLELLWRLHTGVALAVSVAGGMAVMFYVATTFLPMIQHGLRLADRHQIGLLRSQCPFKSPQAWLALRLFSLLLYHWPWLANRRKNIALSNSWVDFDLLYERYFNMKYHNTYPDEYGPSLPFRGLAWLVGTMTYPAVHDAVWHCVWGLVTNARKFTHRYVHADVLHVIRAADRYERDRPYQPFSSLTATRACVLKYARRTTMDRNDLLLLFSQEIHHIGREDVPALWDAMLLTVRHVDKYFTVRKDTLFMLIRAIQRLMHATKSSDASPIPKDYDRMLVKLAHLLRYSRFLDWKLRTYMCAVCLRWLRDQSSPDRVRPVVKEILPVICLQPVSVTRRRLIDIDQPHVGVYLAFLRKSVELLCNPLPDVNWIEHITSTAPFDWIYQPLLELAFHERCGRTSQQAEHHNVPPPSPSPIADGASNLHADTGPRLTATVGVSTQLPGPVASPEERVAVDHGSSERTTQAGLTVSTDGPLGNTGVAHAVLTPGSDERDGGAEHAESAVGAARRLGLGCPEDPGESARESLGLETVPRDPAEAMQTA